MSSSTAVRRAIIRAESILPGRAAPEGQPDPRWQAILRVAEFIKSEPLIVLEFALRWGKHPQGDLRMAVATCLLEHLVEDQYDLIVPLVREAASKSVRFASTVSHCWVGPANSRSARGFERLKRNLRGPLAVAASRNAKRRISSKQG